MMRRQPQREDAAPGVDQLRQEVESLRQDVDTIRSSMQEMHREVGSAVLLLSRFVGLQWNADEALRRAKEKTASASEAVDRLSDNVGTLEQRLKAAEGPAVEEGAKGGPAGGGGGATPTPTHPSPAGTGNVAREAKSAERGDGGGGGGCTSPPSDAGDDVVSSPSLSTSKSPQAAAGTASVAVEAEAGAKSSSSSSSSSDQEVRSSDQNLQQASSAESTRNQRLSMSSRNVANEESGDEVASPSAPGLSDDGVRVGVGVGGGGESEDSSASSAPVPRRRNNGAPRRDIDDDDEHGSSRRRISGGGGGDGGDRRKDGRSRRSIEGHPIDRPLPGPAAQEGVSSSSSSRGKGNEQVLQRPSTTQLSPLRRSRVSAVADGGGGGSDTVGANVNPAPHKSAAGAAAATMLLAEEGKEQADRDELKGAATSSTAPEKSEVGGAAAAAVTAASEVGSSVVEKSAMEAEDGRKNRHARRVEKGEEGGSKPTDDDDDDDDKMSGAAATTKVRSRNHTSVSKTERADELALSASARAEALATDPNGAIDIHGSGQGQGEDEGTTPHTTTQAVVARNTGTTTPVVLARSRDSTSERILVDIPGGSVGESSAAQQESVDEEKRNGETDDTVRGRRDSDYGRSNSAAGEPGGLAASRPGPAPLHDGAHGSSSSKGPLQTADRTSDAPKAASSSIKLDPLEPRSTGGGASESAAEDSETAASTGRIYGSTSRGARGAKPRASKGKEDGEGAERPVLSGRLSALGQEAGSTATMSRSTEMGGVAPVLLEASDKRGDVEGGRCGGRSFSDDSSHTSAGSSWTSRTGDSRSSSRQSTEASTRASGPSGEGRAADGAAVKRSNSSGSSGGGRRRSRSSRSKKNQAMADGVVGGTAGSREDTLGAQIGDHQPKVVALSDKRRASGKHVDADTASAVAAVAAAHPPQRGSSSVSSLPSGPVVADRELEVKTNSDR